MKNNRNATFGLAGLAGLVLSGCSAMLDGASHYARSEDVYNATRTAAAAVRIHEANERAKNTAQRGLDNVARSRQVQNVQYGGQGSQGNQDSGMSGNPLLWDLRDAVTYGDRVAFTRNLRNDVHPALHNSSSELFVMQTDGSNLRRLTFDSVPDYEPEWSGQDEIIYITYTFTTKTQERYFVNVINLKTGKKTIHKEFRPSSRHTANQLMFMAAAEQDREVARRRSQN